MQNLRTRLDRLETTTPTSVSRPVRRFVMQAPHGTTHADAVTYLREQGHEIRDTDLNVIRIVVGARDGRPTDLPIADRTPQELR